MATETDSDSDSAQEDRESDNETVNDEEKVHHLNLENPDFQLDKKNNCLF